MKQSHYHKLLGVLLLCFLGSWTLGQNRSTYSASIQGVGHAGFHKIMLGPVIVGKATKDLHDIRILDKKDQQVPFLLKSDPPVFSESNFHELGILSVQKEADKQTHVIIRNSTGKSISELLLVVKNTDAARSVTISGSDDQTQWYVIKENIPLTNLYSNDSDRQIKSIDFPTSTYNFFKIILNGKDLLPFNIVKAGIYENVLSSGKYVKNPDPAISQKDSGKISYVSINFNAFYQHDRIELKLTGPKYFQRKISLAEKGNYYSAADVYSRSGDDGKFSVNIKAKQLELTIENEDNPPLKVTAIQSYQLSKYALAYLDSSETYRLVLGDSSLAEPKYDIGYFRESLDKNASVLEPGMLTSLERRSEKKEESSAMSTVLMWVIIGVVLLLLLYLTIKMTGEVRKRNSGA